MIPNRTPIQAINRDLRASADVKTGRQKPVFELRS
jgi:hypothetical protein